MKIKEKWKRVRFGFFEFLSPCHSIYIPFLGFAAPVSGCFTALELVGFTAPEFVGFTALEFVGVIAMLFFDVVTVTVIPGPTVTVFDWVPK